MADGTGADAEDLLELPLAGLHARLGARFAPFAGWRMPLQYQGVMAEHLHCRAAAGLFDVSHMGQVIAGDGATALERMMPGDLVGLAAGRQRYTVLTTPGGGIVDDLMVACRGDDHLLVLNAARVAADMQVLEAGLSDVRPVPDRALLALQGPLAAAALAAEVPEAADMRFMDWACIGWRGAKLWISRSGYTGEDGFEISVPTSAAVALAEALLAHEAVAPAGLGARDSLRLEAGLPLYGQDLSEETTPVEAGIAFAVGRARRADGARAGGFPGADTILGQLANGAPRRRIGLRPEGRAPMRAGVPLFDEAGAAVGHVTSGGFGPSVGAPVAMALVAQDVSDATRLFGEVRGKRLPAMQVPLPFNAHSFKR